MDILMVTAELAPWVQSSDTGDSVASLSKALRQLGHEVTIALPRHAAFEDSGLLLARRLTPLALPNGESAVVFDGQLPSGVRLALFEPATKRETEELAMPGVLCAGAAALAAHRSHQGHPFNIVHLHDWQAALTALHLRKQGLVSQQAGGTKVVLTVYDALDQGVFSRGDLGALLLDDGDFSAEGVKLGTRVNLLKAGVQAADLVTTISARAATALQDEEEFGAFAKVVAALGQPVAGVLGGLDYAVFNPATDVAVASRYSAEDLASKGVCKTQVLRASGLSLDGEGPLVVAVIDEEDGGAQLLMSALKVLLAQPLQLMVASRTSLHAETTERLAAATKSHPGRLGVVSALDAAAERRLLAAADFALLAGSGRGASYLPMAAQRYGAIPVAQVSPVRADSIVDCESSLATGTGFLFDEGSVEQLVGALQRALSAYGSSRFVELRRRVMRLDLGWERPARRYQQLYRQLLTRK